jgi:hypothetical protein
VLLFVFANSAQAQSRTNVFPQVADGVASDGSYYKSTFMILPGSDTSASITCALGFHGLNVGFDDNSSGGLITVPQGGFYSVTTNANQSLKSGYAVLFCSGSVYAQALYSYYAPNGMKLSEATVFGSNGDYLYLYSTSQRLVADQRGGSQLGLAIANDTDMPHAYKVTFNTQSGTVTQSATVTVSARSSVSKFLTEIVPSSVNTIGVVKVETTDYSTGLYALGLRFTGTTFTTIPANP